MQENLSNLFKKTRNNIVALAKNGAVERDADFDSKEKNLQEIASRNNEFIASLTHLSDLMEGYAVAMTKAFTASNRAVQGTPSEELSQEIQPQVANTGKAFLVAKYKLQNLHPELVALGEECKLNQKLASTVRQNYVLLKTSDENIEKARKKGEPSPKLLQANEAAKADFERSEAEFDTKYNEFVQKAYETFQRTMKAQQYYLILLAKAQYTYFVSNLSTFPLNELEGDLGNIDPAQLEDIIAAKKAEEEAREKDRFINKINLNFTNFLKKDEKKEEPNGPKADDL